MLGLGALSAVRRPPGAAPLLTFALATTLVVAAAWSLVHFPAIVAVPVILGGSAAITAWILYPDSPAYALLALCPFSITFNVGMLKDVYLQDLILAALAVAVGSGILAGVQRETRFRSNLGASLILLWAIVLLWNSLTYRFGSANAWLMSTEVKNVWYTYRQIVRYMLPFPIVALYLRDPHPAGRVVDLVLLVTGGMALYAVVNASQTNFVALGPFETGNQMAGFLVPIVPFGTARLFMAESRRSRVLAAVALLIMLRAIWLTGSRGGMVGCLASFLPLALFLPRRRIAALAMGGAIVLVVAAFIQGDLLNSPKMQRFLTLGQFENTETFRWREEQWAIFMDRLNGSPVMGVGSDVDKSLILMDRAQTPHNSYLAIAMRSGYVGLVLTMLLIVVIALLCVRGLLAPGSHPEARVLWMGLLGSITGLLVHGLGEATLVLSQVLFFLYTMLGFAMVEAAGSSWIRVPDGRPLDRPGGIGA